MNFHLWDAFQLGHVIVLLNAAATASLALSLSSPLTVVPPAPLLICFLPLLSLVNAFGLGMCVC